jgi:hypothetical protein
LEQDTLIPDGTFVEFTWYNFGDDDMWENYPTPDNGAQLMSAVDGSVSPDGVSPEVQRQDTA